MSRPGDVQPVSASNAQDPKSKASAGGALHHKSKKLKAKDLAEEADRKWPKPKLANDKKAWTTFLDDANNSGSFPRPNITWQEVLEVGRLASQNRRHVALPWFFTVKGNLRVPLWKEALTYETEPGQLRFPDKKSAAGWFEFDKVNTWEKAHLDLDPEIHKTDGTARKKALPDFLQERSGGKFGVSHHVQEYTSSRGGAEILKAGIIQGKLNLETKDKSLKGSMTQAEEIIKLSSVKEDVRKQLRQYELFVSEICKKLDIDTKVDKNQDCSLDEKLQAITTVCDGSMQASRNLASILMPDSEGEGNLCELLRHCLEALQPHKNEYATRFDALSKGLKSLLDRFLQGYLMVQSPETQPRQQGASMARQRDEHEEVSRKRVKR